MLVYLAEGEGLHHLVLLRDGQHVGAERGEVLLHGATGDLNDLLREPHAVVSEAVFGLVNCLKGVFPRSLE